MPIHPLTILLINAILPVLNTLFPSTKIVLLSFGFAILLLFVAKLYHRAMRVFLMIFVFLGLYTCSVMCLKSDLLASWFRMALLFLPCFILASVLISEYNSSEILSALQKLHLPKIFMIALTVTLRYIPTFHREFSLIREAMHIRGVTFTLRKPLRTFEYLLVPQLFRCQCLSTELTAAGLTKGLNAPCLRTSFYDHGFSFYDIFLFLVLFVGFGLIQGGVL